MVDCSKHPHKFNPKVCKVEIEHRTKGEDINFVPKTGAFFAPKGTTDIGFGKKKINRCIKKDAKIFKYEGSYEWLDNRGLLDTENKKLKKKYGYNTLRRLWENNHELRNPNDAYFETQKRAIRQIKREKNPDIIHFSSEDDLNPNQFIVLNLKSLKEC